MEASPETLNTGRTGGSEVGESPASPESPGLHRALLPLFDLPRGTGEYLIAEGEIAVQRLLASSWPVTALACTPAKATSMGLHHGPSKYGDQRNALPSIVHLLSTQELSELVGFAFHRGVLAYGPMPELSALPQLDSARPCTVVVAESLADPRNIGAIIRNARALGADLLIADPKAAHPLSRQAIRAAMGHNFALPLWRKEPRAALRQLRDALPGLQVVAASARTQAVPVQKHTWPKHVALLVGHEGDGLSAELLAEADTHVTIPMSHDVDSLNVAAATAILLHSRHAALTLSG